MPLILNIDTATEIGAVGLFENERMLACAESGSQREHASFLQPAVKQMMEEAAMSMSAIDAVAVTIGPGSYTGLRVGLSAAKGLCFALNRPLITVGTLPVMAFAAISQNSFKHNVNNTAGLFCPLIDARRMEVFTALYDASLKELAPPSAIIVDQDFMSTILVERLVTFSGSGSVKLKNILNDPNMFISEVRHNISHLAALSLKQFNLNMFSDTVYAEPFYLKAFYSPL